MPKGIFIIKWDEVIGGTVYMRFPEELEIHDNVVQHIQIAHNFTESYIITEEKDWNSVSFYNCEKEVVIVLVLDKFDEGNDYLIVLEEFNKDLDKYENENELNLLMLSTNLDYKQICEFLESTLTTHRKINFTGGRAFTFHEKFLKKTESNLLNEFQSNAKGIEALYLLNKKINPKLIRKALILNTLILSILL